MPGNGEVEVVEEEECGQKAADMGCGAVCSLC